MNMNFCGGGNKFKFVFDGAIDNARVNGADGASPNDFQAYADAMGISLDEDEIEILNQAYTKFKELEAANPGCGFNWYEILKSLVESSGRGGDCLPCHQS